MDVLVLSHTAHTVVGRLSLVGGSVLGVSDLVLPPHVPPKTTVADSLENVTSHHAIGSGLVSRLLTVERSHGANDVSDTVSNEDTGRRNNSLRVGSNVGGDHDKTDSETDGLTVDEPESDQSGPGVLGCERQERHEGGSEDTDQVTDRHHEETSVGPSGGNKTGDEKGNDLERSSGTVEEGGVEC